MFFFYTECITSLSLTKVQGLLIANYPHDAATVDAVPLIVTRAKMLLDALFAGTGPSFPLIAGAFSCVDRLLFEYSHCFDAKALEALWVQLTAVIGSIDKQVRFNAAAEALHLLSNHAALWRLQVGRDPDAALAMLRAAQRHSAEALKRHADNALYAWMEQVQ